MVSVIVAQTAPTRAERDARLASMSANNEEAPRVASRSFDCICRYNSDERNQNSSIRSTTVTHKRRKLLTFRPFCISRGILREIRLIKDARFSARSVSVSVCSFISSVKSSVLK
jgi:hypothetical protein